MTTIAFDGRYLAADGRATAGGMITSRSTQKIFPILFTVNGAEVKGVMAGAGSFESLMMAKRHLQEFDLFDSEVTPDIDEGTGLLVVLETGELYLLEHNLVPLPQESPCSIGSGSPFALATMVIGKSASEAVEVAKELDCYSGGNVTVFDTKTWKFIDASEAKLAA